MLGYGMETGMNESYAALDRLFVTSARGGLAQRAPAHHEPAEAILTGGPDAISGSFWIRRRSAGT